MAFSADIADTGPIAKTTRATNAGVDALANISPFGTFNSNDFQIEAQVAAGQRVIPVQDRAMFRKRDNAQLESPIAAARTQDGARLQVDVRWKILSDGLEYQFRAVQAIRLLGAKFDANPMAGLLSREMALKFGKELVAAKFESQRFASAVDHFAVSSLDAAIDRYATTNPYV